MTVASLAGPTRPQALHGQTLRRDRRQRGHRARDGPACARRGRRRRPHRPGPGPARGRRARSARAASRPSTPPTSRGWSGSSTSCRTDRPRAGHRPAGPTTRRWRRSTSTEARRDVDDHLLLPIAGRPRTPPARCGPAARCCSWAAPAAAARRRDRADRRRSPPRCRRWSRTSPSSWRRSGSI